MSATEQQPLFYAPPTRQRRWRRTLLIVLLSLAVGVAGKLCWDKFAGGIRDHFTALRAQLTVRRGIATTVEVDLSRRLGGISVFNGWSKPRRSELADLLAIDRFMTATHKRWAGVALWVGTLRNTNGDRIVLLSINSRQWSTGGSNLVSQVLQPASLFAPAVALGPPQQCPLDVVARTARWGKAAVDPNDPSTITIPGIVDGQPTSLSLRLDSQDRLILLAPPATQSSFTGSNETPPSILRR